MLLKNVLPFILAIVFISSVLYGQTSTTGKISGKVIDAETGEPLIGANVFIVGTTFGAAVNNKGTYFILNIPPGDYDIKASYLGYETVVIKNVSVVSNHTTNINFKLKIATVGVEEVVVNSKRPVIVKDLTSSSTNLSSKVIEKAPIEGIRGIMDITPGLQRDANGDFRVRGGEANELKFYVDGVQMGTNINNVQAWGVAKNNSTWMYDFNTLGVKEVNVITGGFNAEYGNAQSGVVNIVSKEGGEQFKGEIRYEYGPPGQYHWGPYLYSKTDMNEWKNWGTFDQWKTKLPIFPDSTLRRLYNQWIDNHTPGEGHKGGAYDYRKLSYQRVLFGFGGPLGGSKKLSFFVSGEYRATPSRVPTATQVFGYQNYDLSLVYKINTLMKLKMRGIYSYQDDEWAAGGGGNIDIRYTGLVHGGRSKYALLRGNPQQNYVSSLSLIWLHSINKNTFYNITMSYQNEQSIAAIRDIAGADDPWWIKGGPWDEGYEKNGITRSFTANDVRIGQYWSKGDLTSQITDHHLVQIGYEGKVWDVLYSGTDMRTPLVAPAQQLYYTGNPWYMATYVQDKMEFQSMVVNLGFRLDGYNMNTPMPVDRFDPFYPYAQPPNDYRGNPEMKLPTTKITFSPRLGISFPISVNTAFHFQYGHFYSMPGFYETIYQRNYFGWEWYGNRDLDPRKTISYELGIQQNLWQKIRLKITGYYNDLVTQTNRLQIHSLTGRQGNLYNTWTNARYGDSKGIEISLENVTPGRWNYSINYSLSRSTTGSVGESELWSPDPEDPRNLVTRRSAASFIRSSDRTHFLNLLISYYIPKDEGINLLGFHPFSDLSVSVIYRAESGLPFTYVTQYSKYLDITNNQRWPIRTSTDLRISKSISLPVVDLTLSLRVTNLFNNKWLIEMTDKSDIQKWIEQNITYDNPSSSQYIYNAYQAYANETRRVYLGLGIRF